MLDCIYIILIISIDYHALTVLALETQLPIIKNEGCSLIMILYYCNNNNNIITHLLQTGLPPEKSAGTSNS